MHMLPFSRHSLFHSPCQILWYLLLLCATIGMYFSRNLGGTITRLVRFIYLLYAPKLRKFTCAVKHFSRFNIFRLDDGGYLR